MPTHDYVIDNQTAPNFRADLNQALQAIVSTNSSTSAPATTYANMMWYDTTNNLLRMRNEADDAWITLGTLDQVSNTYQASYSLGFTPVQQGGGASQGTNKVYIGWDGGGLRAQVDATDLGRIAFGAGYTDAQARTAQAGHAAGGVGSYVFAATTNATSSNALGTTIAGSSIEAAGITENTNNFPTTCDVQRSGGLSGTWRAMGFRPSRIGSSGGEQATLWLRIS